MKVWDLHCDTLSELRRAEQAGRPLSFARSGLHIDLEKLEAGDYLLQCFAAFVDLGSGEDPLVTALEEIDVFKRVMAAYPDRIAPVYTADDVVPGAAMTWTDTQPLHGQNTYMLVASNSYGRSEVLTERMRAKDKRIKRLQKKLSRQERDSKGSRKTSRKINDAHTYGRNVRENFAHQTSHALVSNSDADVIAFEDLKIKNMMAAPKPKYDEAGKPLPSGRSAKAGLHKAIQFEGMWGRTLTYAQYKALRHGKLVVTVRAAYSSQQCPKCGHTHSSNRHEQALFACTNPDCRFNEDHQLTADQVAAMNIAARAVKQIFDDQQKSKERKRLLRMRKKGESSEGQGRGGTPRTVMRSGNVGAAKPVEPMPDTGNLPVSTLAVKPESLDKRVALAGECSSTSL